MQARIPERETIKMTSINPADIETAKSAAGRAAADLIQPGMLVGLGTGSTAAFFIDHLIARDKKENLRVTAVATSEASAQRAANGGIPIRDINEVTRIDITVDGADRIDPQNRMIKGGGGAHLREKIVAVMSDQLIIIIDPSKECESLGGVPLPVEILPFAYRSIIYHIECAGFSGSLRHSKEGSLYVTDSGNYLFDVDLKTASDDLAQVDASLKRIPGVLETGFFENLATQVIVGFSDGHVETRT